MLIRSMTELTKKVTAQVEAAGSDNEDEETLTVRVWHRIRNVIAVKEGTSEFGVLAEIVFMMVPGSVEDERHFSAMAIIKDKVWNRRDPHLPSCVRMFTQDLYTLRSFPFVKAWRPETMHLCVAAS